MGSISEYYYFAAEQMLPFWLSTAISRKTIINLLLSQETNIKHSSCPLILHGVMNGGAYRLISVLLSIDPSVLMIC